MNHSVWSQDLCSGFYACAVGCIANDCIHAGMGQLSHQKIPNTPAASRLCQDLSFSEYIFFLLSLLDKCLLILQSQAEMPPPPPHSFFFYAFSKLRGDLDISSLSSEIILLVAHWHIAKTLYLTRGTQLRPNILLVTHWHNS